MYQRLYICPGIENFYFKMQVIGIFVVYEDYYVTYSYRITRIAILCWLGMVGVILQEVVLNFCTYSLMDTATNKILHAETIDKRELQLQSLNMERERILRALNFLLSKFHGSMELSLML